MAQIPKGHDRGHRNAHIGQKLHAVAGAKGRNSFDRRPFLATDEKLIKLGMIQPGPFLVERRPDHARPKRHWKENLPDAIAYLREQQTKRDNVAARNESECARGSADHRALERVHGRSLFPLPG